MNRRIVGIIAAATTFVAAAIFLWGPSISSELRIDDPAFHWSRWDPLVPTIHRPVKPRGASRTVVQIELPADGIIRTEWLADQNRYTLVVPPGTIADRITYLAVATDDQKAAWTIADVRGTRFDDAGRELFHVYRPESTAVGAPLFGIEWERGDAAGATAAADRLVERLLRGEGFSAPDAALPRRAAAHAVRRFNDCALCHQANQAESSTPRGMVPARATDASGLYGLLDVLRDETFTQTYMNAPHNPNADAPFTTVTCPDTAGVQRIKRRGGAIGLTCPDGKLPRAQLNLAAALDAGDAHGRAVCESRRILYEHMDEMGRRAFASAFEVCGI